MTGWNHNSDRASVLAAADALEAELAALPLITDSTDGDWRVSHERYRRAVEDLRERLLARTDDRPTTCTADSHGARFALHGFRATSTSGLADAIRNWIAQVRRKARADA
jgi:hypothetical protein